jgi:hypothetical protein
MRDASISEPAHPAPDLLRTASSARVAMRRFTLTARQSDFTFWIFGAGAIRIFLVTLHGEVGRVFGSTRS